MENAHRVIDDGSSILTARRISTSAADILLKCRYAVNRITPSVTSEIPAFEHGPAVTNIHAAEFMLMSDIFICKYRADIHKSQKK